MQKSILVTGATGNVGREVTKALLAKDQPVVATVLDADGVRDVPEDDAALTALFRL
jgi:uncharacterized protein YbjT (DUF2867 family)